MLDEGDPSEGVLTQECSTGRGERGSSQASVMLTSLGSERRKCAEAPDRSRGE